MNNIEVKHNNRHSAVKYTGRSTGGDGSKTTMATSPTDGATKSVDHTQTHSSPKYRILPKLLSAKRSQKEKNEIGKTGFHVRVSPLATSTPKDKANGRVMTSQEKRTESRAKRRQYLAGECVSPTSGRAFPTTPEVKHVVSAPKQTKEEHQPCSPRPVRPNSSPPPRPNGTPVSRVDSPTAARPNGTPVSRPNGSPVSRSNCSLESRPKGSPVSRPKSSPPVRPNGSTISRPKSSPPTRPNGSPVSRPTGCPPPAPDSSSGVSTTSPTVCDVKATDTTATKAETSRRTDTTTCKADAKNTTSNTSPNKHKTTNKSDVKDVTKKSCTLNDQCDYTVIRGDSIPAAASQTKTTKPHKSTEEREVPSSCRSAQTSDTCLSGTPSPGTDGSISPYRGYRGPDTAKTEGLISPYGGYPGPDAKTKGGDQKAAHDVGVTDSTTPVGHRRLVGRVTPTTTTNGRTASTPRNADSDGLHAAIKHDNETAPWATCKSAASPDLLHDVVNYNVAMARAVSHNDALSKSGTSGGDDDWTGSAPEHVGAGKVHMNRTYPDEPRTDIDADSTPDRGWTGKKVVRSRSDVFSCGQTLRPVVTDCVKLTRDRRSNRFGERNRPQLPPPPPPTRASLSADDIDTSRLILLSTRRSFTFSDRHSNLRSSFMQAPPKAPPSSETKGEPECSESKPDVTTSGETGIYSLPQPQCYSEDTMKAIKQITDKYDTLQRRRLQAMSFRETGRRKPSDRSLASTTSGAESDPAIADASFISGDRSSSIDAVDGTTDDAFAADEEVSLSAGITQRDIARLELFYGSRDTEIAICRCLADVLFSEKSAGNQRTSPAGWRHAHTGIPVFVLNTGRGTRRRDLRLVLADRDTGFGLWHDKITYLSNYTSHEGATAFHTMQHSSRPIGDLVGLRFYDAPAAETFHARFREMTADPTDELWRVGASGHRKSSTKHRWRLRGRHDASSTKSTTKRDISQPCNFAHVTNVKQLEPGLMSSLADVIASTVARRVAGRSSTSRPSSYSSVASST